VSRGRVIYLLLSAVLSAFIGYLVTNAVESNGLPQATNSSAPPTLSFTAMATSFIKVPIDRSSAATDDLPSATCQWPDGRSSITLAAARRLDCSTFGGANFPIPRANSFTILDSPIGGAPYNENGQLTDDLRFVHLSADKSVIDVGPVLMQFGAYSGGAQPSFVEADGSLWIFDFRTEHGSEVIRVSTTTGAILQRTAMPAISRPVVAVNQVGFWLGQATNSLFSGSPTLGVWLAPVGAKKGDLIRQTDGAIWAMLPNGSSMNVYLSPRWHTGDQSYQIWTFTPAPT